MTEARRQYRIRNPQDLFDLVTQLNLQFGAISDRLDQIEGYRGTPTFKADVDLDGNKAINAGTAVLATDLIPKSQASASAPEYAWPIGSIFIGNISTNPGTLLGIGTWIIIGTGQLHIGTGTDGAGIVGSYGTNIENVLEPRTLIYIWQRTV